MYEYDFDAPSLYYIFDGMITTYCGTMCLNISIVPIRMDLLKYEAIIRFVA